MKKVYKEIGIIKIAKYFFYTIALICWRLMIFSPCRIVFLKIFRVKVGKNCVFNKITFFNLYRGSFANLQIGDNCFVGDEVMLDMADKIILEDHVTLAERVTILTHTNVGYKDHPLQKYFPKFNKPVILKKGCFIGCNVTILPGLVVGESSLVAAGSVITKDVPPCSVVAGVPAQIVKNLSNI